MSDSIVLQPATAADFEQLRSIHRAAMFEEIDNSFGWDDAFQVERLRKHFQPTNLAFIVTGSEVIGCFCLVPGDGEFFLEQFYVLPEWQGRGVGSALLEAILAQMDARGLVLGLKVLKTSRARTWYERYGFRQVDETAAQWVMRRVPNLPEDQ